MDTHTGVNESQPGPKNNTVLDGQNEDSVWPPETDSGGQPPFKYSFSLSHKRIEGGGGTRQVTVRDLPISKTMAGVEMRLISGGIRELHWHVASDISGTDELTPILLTWSIGWNLRSEGCPKRPRLPI